VLGEFANVMAGRCDIRAQHGGCKHQGCTGSVQVLLGPNLFCAASVFGEKASEYFGQAGKGHHLIHTEGFSSAWGSGVGLLSGVLFPNEIAHGKEQDLAVGVRWDGAEAIRRRRSVADNQKGAAGLVGTGEVEEIFILAIVLILHGWLVRGKNHGRPAVQFCCEFDSPLPVVGLRHGIKSVGRLCRDQEHKKGHSATQWQSPDVPLSLASETSRGSGECT
jgi:hypothetical protein